MRQPTKQMGGDGASRGVNTSRGRGVNTGNTTTSQGKQEVLARKTKVAPAAQQQRLMHQQCNVSGSFGGQWVAAVLLVASLAMALAEQWQQ
jgi:hypothetical protein